MRNLSSSFCLSIVLSLGALPVAVLGAEDPFQPAAGPFQSQDVGVPAVGSSVSQVAGGYNITAGGTNIIGTADQFGFNYQQVTGNFDFKVRLAGLSQADSWSKAGLMARDNLLSNSMYACTLATPSAGGAYYQFRPTPAVASQTSGMLPVNYPNTWLRLQRTNNLFTSYASLDGDTWFQLGSSTIAMAGTAYLGMVVSAAVTNGNSVPTVTAQFRDFQPVTGGSIGVSLPDVEPPGPSSRKTPFVITEIMYNPLPRTNASGASLEYIELYNSNPFFEEISRFRFSGDVDYTFPQGTFLQGGEYIVVAKDPAAVTAYYNLTGVRVFGPYTNAPLSRSGTVRLRNNSDGVALDISYSNDPPWPLAADGTGHSLVLARPSYGEAAPRAWGASDALGGSPGRVDSYTSIPARNVVINEFLAHSTDPTGDYIELYNHSGQDVDLSGCSLSEDPTTNKFVFANPTVIPARGFLVFHQPQLGFGLDSGGERVFFRAPNGRVLDVVKYSAQALEVATGRYPDGADDLYPLRAQTPGAANAPIQIHDIVINELMYKPISGSKDDEYVELYNKGTHPISLGGWKFVDGIEFTFPSNTVMNPDSYLVIARDATNLFARYPGVLNAGNTLGNFNKSLSNSGGRVALATPDLNVTTNKVGETVTNTVYVVVDEVTYGTGGNWPKWANEGGSSLELIDPRSNHRLAHNWTDSDETQKAPWTTVEITGPMTGDYGSSPPGATWVEIQALNEAEFLVDNVEAVVLSTGTNYLSVANSTFESGVGDWVFRGTHIRTTLENSGGFGSGRCLHVRTTARGDTAANRCLARCPTIPSTGNPMVRLGAKVRWLKGWPEALVRLHGDWLEAFGRLTVPTNLGTPGQRNSRAATNAPPAIYEVIHQPIVPAANQAVVVTARVHDPDGLSSVSLKYRLDPSQTVTTVAMNDAGTAGDALAGDGIYSATIPGLPAGTMVAFQVVAVDSFGATRIFPLPDPTYKNPFECMVLFGDTVAATAFGTYRQWMSVSNLVDWQGRPALSNERQYETFVYGNFRVIYNAAVKWAGSPYHQFSGNPTNTAAHYSFDLPLDDILLGTENINKVHAPGNGPFGDQTIQREQICYWMARQMNLPWGYRRYVNMFFNGNRRGGTTAMMEDSQTPGADMIEQYFPDDTTGNLYKLQPWFEQDDPSSGANNMSWCTLLKFTTLSNGVPVHKTARYRQNYLTRGAHGTANDYQPVFDLIDAANTTGAAAQYANFSSLVDVDEYFRILAVEHASGNWDAVGSQNQQNMYGYRPDGKKWRLMIWDWNIVLGSSASDTGSWGPGVNLAGYAFAGPGANDTNMTALFNNPPLRRIYLRGLKELAKGPMLTANIEPPMDAKYRAFLASGITPVAPGASDVKTFINSQRSAMLTLVTNEEAAAFKVTSPLTTTTNGNLVLITGEAPVDAKTIKVNGTEYPVTWTSVRAFRIVLVATNAINHYTLQAYDNNGNAIAGATADVVFNYTGTPSNPDTALLFDEIMYHPVAPEASYLEIYNNSDTAFDLAGWRVNGVDFTFPLGSVITNRQYLVLAKNRSAYASSYPGAPSPAGEFDGQLDNGGETITLERPTSVLATNGVIVTTNLVFVSVNRIRYDDDAPWAPAAAGFGPALQLIDVNQDNRRVSNWSDHEEWRFASYTANMTFNIDTNFLLWLSASNYDLYVDDIVLVTGLVAQAGQNLLSNGSFESPFSDSPLTGWVPLGNHSNSVISTQYSHSGNSSLHIISAGLGGPPSSIRQDLPAFVTNTPCTVSFWFRPTTNATTLTIRARNGSQFNSAINVRPTAATPGLANTTADTLPPYDPLWLNEIQPNNAHGIVDNFSEHDPWIELYNSGPDPIDLSGYYLGDNYTNHIMSWSFPAGSTLAPGAFKIIWADGQPEQTAGTQWHTSFRMNSATGSVALVRLVQGKPQITDYLNYSGLGPDLSYGDFPNGQPVDRQKFFGPTPGAPNNGKEADVFINEWMASNTNYLADPADGKFDDWFELYNGGAQAIDLGGYWLTDNLLDPHGFQIPDNGQYVLPPGGFLLVWADNETNENTAANIDLHVSFQLSKEGEQIGLFAPNAFTLIDGVTFGTQTNNTDVSEGRFPDGGRTIARMTTPTPRGANTIGGGNAPPSINPISDKTVTLGQTLSFTVTATDPDFPGQSLSFSLVPGYPTGAAITSAGLFTWTPTPAQAPSVNTITVRVTDTGVPPLSATRPFTVTVATPPHTTITQGGNGQFSLSFDSIPGKTYRVEYKNSLNDAQWLVLKTQVATSSTLTVVDDLGGSGQRFYRVVLVD
jgi:hypothetical protein